MTPGQRTTRRRPAVASSIATAAALGLVLALAPTPVLASESDDGTDVTLDVRIAPIDTTAPEVEIVFGSAADSNNGNGNGNGKPKGDAAHPGKTNGKHDEYTAKGEVRVTVNSIDPAPEPISGVATVEVSLDGGPWLPYTAPFAVRAHGKHKVSARAADVAGNVGDIEVRTFKITGRPLD
ncbi:OmpL47-type beta-barrel domain-containing protein [Agromyces cerinus]|uniref:Ig-like domain (Group 3) n=1 Tax=Agromyces cerinus subsp. cerinus TaxID=232089 RepID=A0A1N6GUU1_9MICO|nr:hypothetical protein [Agromyces cerinus]SIO11351.1 hypothetical protein SAMN05443544_2897 [Agromyces cerinus subsp. cerinus]